MKSTIPSLMTGRVMRAMVIMLFFTGSIATDAYTQSEDDLSGDWTGTDFSFNQLKGPDISAMIEGGRSLHIGGMLILKANKMYQVKDPQGTVNGKGKWIVEKQGSFITYEPGGEKTEYQIVTLDKSTLITTHKVAMDTPEGVVEGEITLTYKK